MLCTVCSLLLSTRLSPSCSRSPCFMSRIQLQLPRVKFFYRQHRPWKRGTSCPLSLQVLPRSVTARALSLLLQNAYISFASVCSARVPSTRRRHSFSTRLAAHTFFSFSLTWKILGRCRRCLVCHRCIHSFDSCQPGCHRYRRDRHYAAGSREMWARLRQRYRWWQRGRAHHRGHKGAFSPRSLRRPSIFIVLTLFRTSTRLRPFSYSSSRGPSS
jgi:hypothetical protein